MTSRLCWIQTAAQTHSTPTRKAVYTLNQTTFRWFQSSVNFYVSLHNKVICLPHISHDYMTYKEAGIWKLWTRPCWRALAACCRRHWTMILDRTAQRGEERAESSPVWTVSMPSLLFALACVNGWAPLSYHIDWASSLMFMHRMRAPHAHTPHWCLSLVCRCWLVPLDMVSHEWHKNGVLWESQQVIQSAKTTFSFQLLIYLSTSFV